MSRPFHCGLAVRLLFAALLFNGGCSSTDQFFHSAGNDLPKLPAVIVDNTMEIVAVPDYQLALLLAGGGSIALRSSTADRRVANNFGDHHGIRDKAVDEIVSNLGGPAAHFGAAGIWYALSSVNNDEFNRQRSWTMLKALSVTGAATLGLKLIVNDDTPNGKDLAWPSGHTSSSFCVAAVLDEFYGPSVGIPAYIGAGFVGYRMMDAGDHWASDVLFGAVLGYIVGHHVAGKDKQLQIAGFELVPFGSFENERALTGIALMKTF